MDELEPGATVGGELKRWRKVRGYSRNGLSKITRIPNANLRRIEDFGQDPKLGQFGVIVRVLNLDATTVRQLVELAAGEATRAVG